eukprot:TRINITY_DN22453_c0_g1_i1.p1 TRINITY_DN22453_c0_g1~~TRINITY_DN22453_c0_g1_i1.p1  ORF type:complete len:151 (-),score=39.29 TRINITY_DN22453_c0_g1_i1:137-589(-)
MLSISLFFFFFFQAEDGIRDAQESRGLGDVYKRQEVKRVINSVHGEGFGLSRILSIGRGLVVGGDGGVVSVLSRVTDGTTYFQPFRQFSVLSNSRVLELAVSPKEETLAIAYGDNTVGTVSLDLLDIQRDRVHLEPISTPIGFHLSLIHI